MTSTKKENKRTVSGGSDIPEAGAVSGIVPARPVSSSDVGLPSALTAGAGGEVASAALKVEVSLEGMLPSASSAGLSSSSPRMSLRSNKSNCSMEVDKENRKRSRANMLEKKDSAKEEEDPEEDMPLNRRIIKRGRRKITSDDEEGNLSMHEGNLSMQEGNLSTKEGYLSAQEGNLSVKENSQMSSLVSSKEQARHVLISDDDADCYVVTGPDRKEKKGEEARIEVTKEEGKFGIVLKKKRGRKRKIHRKKIGLDELGVHEIEDTDDSEGYDALSAPEMAATAIEYLEEADQIRIKCKNIKGDLSGVMKRRLHNAKEIIKGLARTISKVPQKKEGGDVEDETCFLRMENKELKIRLKEKEKNCQKKEKEIQLLRNELKDISDQMKAFREEITEMKRNSGKIISIRNSPKSRSEIRMNRTLEAIENGEDTSIAEDSEAMEVEQLPTFEWSGTNEDQTFKRPYPVSSYPSTSRGGGQLSEYLKQKEDLLIKKAVEESLKDHPSPSTSRGNSQLLEHLKQKENTLVRKAVEESLEDYKDIREKVRKYGTLAQVEQKGKGKGKGEEYPELPKPQRLPRIIQPRSIRTDIKVLENIQIKKPRIEEKENSTADQEGRAKENKDQEWIIKKSRKEVKKLQERQKSEQTKRMNLQQSKEKPKVTRRLPRSSAVTLRISEENKEKYSYADILRTARDKISLEKLGIEKTRIRKTAGGNILIAIPGANRGTEADKLAEELAKVLDKEVTIARPSIMGELRLFGLDDSISTQEVKETISVHGTCKLTEIQTSEIKTMRNGLGMIWVKCPLTTATQLSKMEKIRIGWSVIKVEMLQPREKQCFRCWRFGHLKYTCKSEINRTGCCYRCGSSEHKVKECNKEAQCMVCKENHAEWHHRMGSIACVRNRRLSKEAYKTANLKNNSPTTNVNTVDVNKRGEDMEVCTYVNNYD